MRPYLWFLWLALVLAAPSPLRAQPQPGEVFREYYWTNAGGDGNGWRGSHWDAGGAAGGPSLNNCLDSVPAATAHPDSQDIVPPPRRLF